MLDYNGAVTYEDIYFAKVENLFFPIQRILFLTTNSKNIASIGKIYEGHLSAGFKEFIPFAIDPGGWDYNFSFDEQSFGQIWINSFDDNEENPFSFVASSLEEFVDGLITENEAIKLGY